MADMGNEQNSHAGKTINPVVAGVTGAIIGAGMAAVTTKVLSNKKTRDKIVTTALDIRNRISDSMKNMRKGIKKQKGAL